jgi:type IV pilus assembly protein PilA
MRVRARIAHHAGDERGFTLIELLVVTVILGLLAGIAIPSFFAQRDKARDAAAKEAVRSAQTTMETYATEAEGEYTAATLADLRRIEATLNDATLAIDSATAQSYAVTVTSATGNTFTITRNPGGTTDLTCATPGDAGCPPSGVWSE